MSNLELDPGGSYPHTYKLDPDYTGLVALNLLSGAPRSNLELVATGEISSGSTRLRTYFKAYELVPQHP